MLNVQRLYKCTFFGYFFPFLNEVIKIFLSTTLGLTYEHYSPCSTLVRFVEQSFYKCCNLFYK